jgi:anti-anti-sigma regulatory factor
VDLDNQLDLERAVLGRLETGSVVLECSALEFLSVSALRSLSVCAFAAQMRGHDFVLDHPAPHVCRLLALAGLDHLRRSA